MNKKILMSLVVIGVVAAIVAGTTGAWWTDVATSSNTSFHSGNMDLQLANSGGDGQPAGGWHDHVTQTWDYQNMVPAGESVGSSLWLRNNGNTPADWLKFETETDPSPVTMNEVMRITKLAYAGENLLTGGAGADLSGYESPTICNIGVLFGSNDYDTISEAVAAASDGNIICVGKGNYTDAWEMAHGSGYPITVNTPNITIVGVNSPAGGDAAIVSPAAGDTEAFLVTADGVTIKGLKIDGSGTTFTGGQLAGIQISPSDNVTVRDNVITNLNTTASGASSKGIQLYYVGGNEEMFKNTLITNNDISGVSASTNGAYGIQTVGRLENVVINHNTTRDINGYWEAGLAIDSKQQVKTIAEIKLNDLKSETVSLQVEMMVRGDLLTVEKNHLESLYYGGSGNVVTNPQLVAEKNWWGDWDPSDQVLGNVDYDPYLGGPHIGFINGNDQNGNGFADLEDLHVEDIVVGNPQLDAGYQNFELYVQLDGPTSTNDHQKGNVGLDITVTMGQGPAPSGN